MQPAQHLRAFCTAARGSWRAGTPLVLCAKGIELGSGLLLTDVAAELLPEAPVAVLSGPSFASEVAAGLPTAVVIASADAALNEALMQALSHGAFRPYGSLDPVGVELAGAAKNVLAIACGIVMGKGLGENARAALVTRGLAELARLAHALGGRAETMLGLAGVGDVVLTCNSMKSRNASLGFELGRGRALAEILGAAAQRGGRRADRRGARGAGGAARRRHADRQHGRRDPVRARRDRLGDQRPDDPAAEARGLAPPRAETHRYP